MATPACCTRPSGRTSSGPTAPTSSRWAWASSGSSQSGLGRLDVVVDEGEHVGAGLGGGRVVERGEVERPRVAPDGHARVALEAVEQVGRGDLLAAVVHEPQRQAVVRRALEQRAGAALEQVGPVAEAHDRLDGGLAAQRGRQRRVGGRRRAGGVTGGAMAQHERQVGMAGGVGAGQPQRDLVAPSRGVGDARGQPARGEGDQRAGQVALAHQVGRGPGEAARVRPALGAVEHVVVARQQRRVAGQRGGLAEPAQRAPPQPVAGRDHRRPRGANLAEQAPRVALDHGGGGVRVGRVDAEHSARLDRGARGRGVAARGRVDDQRDRLRRQAGVAEHGRDGEPVHARPRGQPGLHVLHERRVALALGGGAAQAPGHAGEEVGHRRQAMRSSAR